MPYLKPSRSVQADNSVEARATPFASIIVGITRVLESKLLRGTNHLPLTSTSGTDHESYD